MSTAARIDELRKKFEENPRRYFAPLANEYRKSGELAQAIALCREHLPKQPGHMSGYIVFGQALYESGELGEARSVFEQALALDPENLIALRHLGDIARASGDAQSARRWYERVLDADPRNDDIAAQLATLATGATPVSVPAVTPEVHPFARLMETPPISMSAIGLAAMPTPDSVMRAVDFDEINARVIHRTPIDLDAVDANLAPTHATNPDQSAIAESASDAMAEFESNTASEAESAQASDVEIPAYDAAADPFAFPPSHEPIDVEWTHTEVAASADALVETDEAFEEGLVAPVWPDTSDLVARVVTPRSNTPRSATPISVDANSDTVSAFGREAHDPVDSSADAIDSVEPIFDVPKDPRLTPIDLQVVADGLEQAVTADFDDVDTESTSVESLVEPAYAASFEEPDVIAISNESTSESASDSAIESANDESLEEPVVASSDEPIEESIEESIEWRMSDTVEAAIAEAELYDLPVTSVESSETSSIELPWLGTAEPRNTVVDEFAETQPGLEELAEAFAADARAAGDDDVVTVAALDELPPVEAIADGVSFDVSVDVHSEYEPEDEPDLASESVRESVSDSPAFVTETMAELLVAQGFIARSIDVYEELVRRRPYDEVLTSRLAELRAMSASPSAEVAAESIATPADVADEAVVADLFAEPVRTPPWSVSGVQPVLPTPAYGTPAFGTPAYATPVIPLSAMAESAWVTPPRVTPYAQPALHDDGAAPRLAGEWFAMLAARRVPRRTPAQAAVAVPSTPEGLASLFGAETSANDDAAARALADAFAPVSADDLATGATLDFEFARSTPAYSQTVGMHATPPTPSIAIPPTVREAPTGGGGNAGFSFDKFFPDPATRRGTPSASSPPVSDAPVTDDLAQFSAWLKGLGNT